MKTSSKTRTAYTSEQALAMLTAPAFIPPKHLRSPQFAEDFKDLDKLRAKHYHDYLILRGLLEAPRAHNDPKPQPPRARLGLTFVCSDLSGEQPMLQFMQSDGTMKMMTIERVQENLKAAFAKATAPIGKSDPMAAGAKEKKRNATSVGLACFKALQRVSAKVEPKRTADFFRRIEKLEQAKL